MLLPPDARFCPSCAAPVEPGPAAKERKVATVLFADLVGSTELGGSLDPEHTRDLLDRFYDAMAAEIALGGGTVEKFIGDAVVAVFGAPTAQEDHAERALYVALWLQSRLKEVFDERLALRIGVNTGEVVVGRPREGSSFVTGDAVNVAARLEQAAGPGQILVGERTAALAGEGFEFGEATSVDAKGKQGGVACRELVRMLSHTRPRGGRGLEAAFVGRERELQWLEQELRLCSGERRPRLANLVGEPGVGKTSLVRAFRERLPEDVRVRLGRCLSYGRGITYSPLADVLREELGVRQEDSAETVLARLAGREILGLTLGLDVAGDLDPRAAGLRLHAEWVRLLSELAAERPVVLIVEDLHWANDLLLELLERVLAEVEGPLLVLATTRPAEPGRMAGESLLLQPLSDEEAGRMLDRVLGAPLQGSARELVVRHAEGNPFFLEEVLSSLIDQGLLERRNGGWALHDEDAGLGIPDSVQAVLAARIDLLPPPAKEALQAASVIGRSFSSSGLAALVGPSAAELRTLVERGFVRATEPELVFKHALTRQVAYSSLPKASRARLHATFAAWLEQSSAGRDERAAALAYHYAESVNPEIAELAWRGQEAEVERLSATALHWLRRAAELAVGRSDIEEALALLHRALELEPRDADLWWAVGRANALKFDGEAYWQAMQRAIEATDDRRTLAEIYGELAFESTMRGAMWKHAPEDELVGGWVERALELAEPGSRAHTRAMLTQGFRADDVEATERGIAIAEQLDDVELLSYGFNARSGIAYGSSEYGDALAWDHRRRALAGRITDPDHLALLAWSANVSELGLGRFEEARAQARRQEEISASLSYHHVVHAVEATVSIEEAMGRWGVIRELQPRVERSVAENAATPCAMNACLLLSCAVACAELGDEDEARRLERAEADLDLEGYQIWLDPLRARLALIRGDLELLERLLVDSNAWQWGYYRHLVGLVTRLDALVVLGRTSAVEEEATRLAQPGTYPEPFALRALGLVRGDDALLAQAIARFEAMGLDWHASKTQELTAAGWSSRPARMRSE